jgi:hypothetical protein
MKTMNRFVIIICLSAAHFSCAQKVKWNQIIVDSKGTYNIPNEGKVVNTLFDVPETRDTIKSGLILDNDTLFTIFFTKAKLDGDTLKISIHQTDPAYHQECLITVVKNKFNIDYDLRTGLEPEENKMRVLQPKLKLNTLDFKKGKKIRGYTEYTGKCVKGCLEESRPVTVKGNFSVIIE